jgi:branched-chain amino acid transport system substrate-binding protein
MKKIRCSRSLVRLSVIAALALSAPAMAQGPIRVGMTASQSGPYDTQGMPVRNGYLLCEKHVNERGGLLGRRVEFLIRDDQSDTTRAPVLYEKLIAEEKVDAVLGPYGSPLTESVAPIVEKHRKVMLAPLAATSSIWEKGRRYIVMQLGPSELFLAGLIDLAARHGLKTVALVSEDTIFPRSAAKGTIDLARKNGLEVVLTEEYAKGSQDFTAVLAKIKAINPDVLGIASANLTDFIAFARQMKERDVNIKMFGTTTAVAEFQQALGKAAEFAYGASPWEPSVPYPGVKEFVDAYQKEFQKPPSLHAAGAYAGCHLFMEAARRAGSVDSERVREQLLKLKTTTIFGDYAVDDRGYQIANKGLLVQWQDGQKVVVWPDRFATAKPRLPTPVWNQR